MLSPAISICLLFLARCAKHVALLQDESCPSLQQGESPTFVESDSNRCDPANSGRGLLQTSSERLSHPAVAAKEAVPSTMLDQVSASKAASSTHEEADEALSVGNRVKAITGLLSFGRGITSAEEHISAQVATGNFEELTEPRLAGSAGQEEGYEMMASVGDVSSVLTLSNPTSRGKDPHRRLLLVEDSAQALRSMGLLAVVIIIIVSIFVVLLAGFAGSRSDDDRSEIFSSDSEKFGSAPTYKSRLSPKMPGRYSMRREEPRRMEPPHDQFSPAPSMRQPMQEGPPPSRDRFSPIPPARPMGKGGSPYAPPAQPYQRMQPPPSNTAMPPPEPVPMPMPMPMPGPPDSSAGASRPPTTSGSSSRHLCPGLVVPRGNECVLAVPTLRALNVPPRNTAAFFVRDLGGKPVIQAEILVQPWTSLGAGVGQRPIAVLRTAISQGDEPATISDLSPLLAYVKASFEAGGRRSAYVYDARDEIFAHVAKDPFRSCYVLTSSRMGVQVIFTGTFPDHHVQVTNEARESLAEVEPCTPSFDPSGDYYKIRVVSHVDVGLILCGLLAIEHMEAS